MLLRILSCISLLCAWARRRPYLALCVAGLLLLGTTAVVQVRKATLPGMERPYPLADLRWSRDGKTLLASYTIGKVQAITWDSPGPAGPGAAAGGHPAIRTITGKSDWDALETVPDEPGDNVATIYCMQDGSNVALMQTINSQTRAALLHLISFWDMKRSEVRPAPADFALYSPAVRDVPETPVWSPANPQLIAAATCQGVRIWDTATDRVTRVSTEDPVRRAICWSPDGAELAYCDNHNSACIYNLATGATRTFAAGAGCSALHWAITQTHGGGGRQDSGAPCGLLLCVSPAPRILDAATGEWIALERPAERSLDMLSPAEQWQFSPDGTRLAAVDDAVDESPNSSGRMRSLRLLRVWEIPSGRLLHSLDVRSVTYFKWSRDSSRLATVCTSDPHGYYIQWWDARTGTLTAESTVNIPAPAPTVTATISASLLLPFPWHSTSRTTACLSPDLDVLAIGLNHYLYSTRNEMGINGIHTGRIYGCYSEIRFIPLLEGGGN